MAFFIIAFITLCSLPDWVRWHSSTKTNISPTVFVGPLFNSSINSSKFSTSLLPNLCTSEHNNRGSVLPNCSIKSLPLVVRTMPSPASLNTRSICLSSSSRSVIITTRALGLFSRIHFASHTITRLLPLPCVCQIMPPSRLLTCSCAALTPKYWCVRQSFFTPPSNRVKL